MQQSPPLRVTSLDKANLLAACGRLWRGIVSEVMAREFPEVEVQHMLIDSAAMVLVKEPKRLNGVVLTSNMFGDIISDEASVIPGSLGLLPSASLSGIPDPKKEDEVRVKGLYEPIHGQYWSIWFELDNEIDGWIGSAPDIAGRNVCNPVGMILSVALMLRYSLGLPDEAEAVEEAICRTIEKGIRTADIGGSGSTKAMGDEIARILKEE